MGRKIRRQSQERPLDWQIISSQATPSEDRLRSKVARERRAARRVRPRRRSGDGGGS